MKTDFELPNSSLLVFRFRGAPNTAPSHLLTVSLQAVDFLFTKMELVDFLFDPKKVKSPKKTWILLT